MRPCELLRSMQAGDSSPSKAARVGIINQISLEHRFANVHDCVMNQALTKRRGGDQPLFGVKDLKLGVISERKRVVAKLASNYGEILLQLHRKQANVGTITLPAARFPEGETQILTIRDLWE